MTDPRVQRVLQAGVQRLLDALRQVGPAAVDAMDRQLQAGVRADGQRFTWQLAIGEMRRKMAPWHQAVAGAMQARLQEDLQQGGESDGGRRFSDTDWRTLALVDDQEVERQVKVDRAARTLAADCDWEFKELEGQVGLSHNPVRPERVVQALQAGVEVVSQDAEVRAALLQQLVRTLAPLMKNWYAAMVKELTRQGVQAPTMAVRQADGPGFDLPRDSHRDTGGYETLQARPARVAVPPSQDPAAVKALGAMFGVPVPSGFGTTGSGRGGLDAGPSSRGGVASRPGALGGPGGTAPGGPAAAAADAQLRDVMRRMTLAALPSLEQAPPMGRGALPGGLSGGGAGGSYPGAGPSAHGGGPAHAAGAAPLWSDGIDWSRAGDSQSGAPVAANLIRLHRDQLMEASDGAINHMVIDVVAALFDQILADPKVPPQMARLIARLQLPVLRAALQDIDFFRRRNHPVRRLVNRIASLSAAFDDFAEGPGLEFLDRVRRLVQEIIDGDFDQVKLYERQLDELEALVREQTAEAAPANRDIAALLQEKEATLRVQQRYTLALKEQLAKIEIAEFARDFLSQIWSQVVVLATQQEGPDGALVKRMKDAGRELALSLQPKGTPQHRKEFLMRLPALMKDLNEGLGLIRWPEKARKEFFGKLLPAHAESLKGQPLSDFAQRQLQAQLDQVDRVHVPDPAALQPEPGLELPVLSEEVVVDAAVDVPFTEDEMRRVGLVDEQQVDWDGQVDIDLDNPSTVPGEHQEAQTSTMDLDLNLDAPPAPGQGTELLQHMQPGCAYLMQVDQGGWKKVRLSWVSPGRGFFVFNHGRKQQKTVSMTSRMLHRMLESGRFRAFEQRELIERATIRARRQLAALGGAGPVTRH